jgi:MFS family permease
VVRLGLAQTLAWASSFYLPAILAPAMARDLGLGQHRVWLAFSLALVVSGVVAPLAGRLIDRRGGRPVLMATNGLFAVGLVMLALAQGQGLLFAAWLLLGVAMGSGLYEAAFASLVRLQGDDARASITGITLIAGFASTVGWPLSSWLEHQLGWRGACLVWATLHLVLGLPLNAWLPRLQASRSGPERVNPADTDGATPRPPPPPYTAALLAYVFAVVWFIATAMAAHLPQLLVASGLSLAGAVGIAALVGPAQVAGRLLEFGWLRKHHPLLSARLAGLCHPIGVLLWLVIGPVAAPVFALLHGAGNGILTIAKGTLPLVMFGPQGYGERQGLISAPGRLVQAFAPLVFAAAMEQWGVRSLWLTAGLALSALLALLRLRSD